jgi:F-type H+-transporting ATPase subunit epsilon
VLTGHTPFLTSLKTGVLKYRDASGSERVVFINSGFAEALPDKVTVLAESAERRRNIDEARVRAAIARSEKRLSDSDNADIDFERARAALNRAIMRLSVIQTR